MHSAFGLIQNQEAGQVPVKFPCLNAWPSNKDGSHLPTPYPVPSAWAGPALNYHKLGTATPMPGSKGGRQAILRTMKSSGDGKVSRRPAITGEQTCQVPPQALQHTNRGDQNNIDKFRATPLGFLGGNNTSPVAICLSRCVRTYAGNVCVCTSTHWERM